MPAGAINALDNITASKAKPKPYVILIFLVLLIFILIYSQRLLNIESEYYNLFIVMSILILTSFVLASTIVHNFKITHNDGLEYLSNIFNSTPSRNFMILFSFLLFVMFIYESSEYENNDRYVLLDKMLGGNNHYISNRSYGLLLIVIFGIYTGYSIYVTTNEC